MPTTKKTNGRDVARRPGKLELPQRSRWTPRRAVLELKRRFLKNEAVLGVGFGGLEDDQGNLTGRAGLIVLVDASMKQETDKIRKLVEQPVGGYPVMVRAPRTTFEAYHKFLKQNGVPNPERFDCLPDPFWLDPSKIHRMVQRGVRRPRDAAPSDPATAVFGEIFVIEDDGTLVSNPGTASETVDYQAIFVKFRTQFGDHYDFAYIHHDTASGLNGGGGVSPTIYNQISGINHYKGDSYNGRTGWNTSKLQSYQAVRSFQMRRMLHETAHRWLAYANHTEGGSSSSNLHEDLITTNPGQGVFHWGNWYDDDNSCMDYDYFDWIDAPGGYQQDSLNSGAAASDEFRFTDVDLYLMGLMDPSEVDAFRYIESPDDSDGDGIFTGTLHPLTIANITSEHGARNPAAADSQRVFHQAYILLTRDIGNVGDLTAGVVQTFDQWRRDFEQRFREAVLGRAMIDTRLLHGNYSSLYIRDNTADTGTGTSTGRTWDSPDIWVRQHDDGVESHETTDRSMDNYLHARIWNSSAADYEDVTVRFYIGNHAENLPGTDFEYPEDWRLDRFLGEQTITVPAAGSAVAKITWHQADIPPAAGWHPCLLVEVLPMEITPDTLHRRTENKKLAQKNITIEGSPSDPGDGMEFRFTLGRPRKRSRTHVLVLDRIHSVPGLTVSLLAETADLALIPDLGVVSRPPRELPDPPMKLRHVETSPTPGLTGSRIFVPAGGWLGYSAGGGNWTSLRFVTHAVIELGAGLKMDPGALIPRQLKGTVYQELPSWYRTAIRVSGRAGASGVQVVRARIAVDPRANPEPKGPVRLSFMEYEEDGRLVGGVEYAIDL